MTAETNTKSAKQIPIFIDQQKFELEPGVYTAAQLLEMAGENPGETTLVLRHGNDLEQIADDHRFEPKPGSHFVVFHSDPTPVS